jgi:hypothetical protein
VDTPEDDHVVHALAHSLTLAVATHYASARCRRSTRRSRLSILFLGPEIVRYQRGETSLTIRHPWVVAFAFGLLHGFGFASGLSTIGLPHGDIPAALLFFNVGVEAWTARLRRPRAGSGALVPRARDPLAARCRDGPGYAVGSLGAFWTIQRTWMLFGALR